MALRGTGYAKRPAGSAATQANVSARMAGDAEPATRVVPLELGALLAPYRGHGRISLRVERLPHRTRLSRGQNNGDRSWSLTLDDLDGLNYLAPGNLAGVQTLSIRIVSLDGGDGATVAVLEHSIPSAEDTPAPALKAESALPPAQPGADNAVAERLRADLEKLKASLAAQETALADVQQTLDREWEARSRQMADSELKAARIAWEGEAEKRLAVVAARAAADVEKSRKAWKAERDAELATSENLAKKHLERERARWRKDSEDSLANAEKAWKASEAARIAAAEEKWRALSSQLQTRENSQREFEALLAEAEERWKERESARLADAEAQWRASSSKALAEAVERATKEAELLRSKLESELKGQAVAQLTEAKTQWRQQSNRDLAEARTLSEREAKSVLEAAQKAWKEKETGLIAAVDAKWQERCAGLVAEARAQALAEGKADEGSQLGRLRDELAAAKKAAADRDVELVRARKAAEEANEQLRQQIATTLSDAQKAWNRDEAARFAAAEAKWQEQSARLVAETRAQASAAGKADEVGQTSRLRDELAFANKTLADRDAEIAQIRRAAEDSNERLQGQLAYAVSDAQKIWSVEEAARLATAEAQWREQSAKALADARASAPVPDHKDDSVELDRLRNELAAARSTLADRDAELARSRQAVETTNKEPRRQNEAALAEARNAWSVEEAARLEAAQKKWREQSESALAEATARYKQAEAELAAAQEQSDTPQNVRDTVEILRLRDEVEQLKSTVAIRDVELAQAHATAEQFRTRLASEREEILPSHNRGGRRSMAEEGGDDGEETAKRPIWRDIALVAAVVAFGILLYPHIVSMLPDDWWPASSTSDDSDTAPEVHRPAPAPAAAQATDVIVHAANVRSGPSKTAAVVATLDRDVNVRTVERRGNWAHIEFSVGDAKKHEGWVYSSFLKPVPTSSSTPAQEGAH